MCAEMTGDVELVFGSDEERAMVNAFRTVFPAAQHVFCHRHLQENARRYMSDTAGVAVDERNTVNNKCHCTTLNALLVFKNKFNVQNIKKMPVILDLL